MNTIKDHLLKLPEGVRDLAIANATKSGDLDCYVGFVAVGEVVATAFMWNESPEGIDFWAEIAREHGWIGL